MNATIKTPGRPAISEQVYTRKIETLLNKGLRIDEITATKLQKAVGGQYRKASDILERFKDSYNSKALANLPPMPEALATTLNNAALDIWRTLWNEKEQAVSQATQQFEQETTRLESITLEQAERIDELLDEISALKNHQSELTADLDKALQEKDALNEEFSSTQINVARVVEKNSQLESQLQDIHQKLDKEQVYSRQLFGKLSVLEASQKMGESKEIDTNTQGRCIDTLDWVPAENQNIITGDAADHPDTSKYPEVVPPRIAETVIENLKESYDYKLGTVIKSQLGFDMYRCYGCPQCKQNTVVSGRLSKARIIEIHQAIHDCRGAEKQIKA